MSFNMFIFFPFIDLFKVDSDDYMAKLTIKFLYFKHLSFGKHVYIYLFEIYFKWDNFYSVHKVN